MGRGKAQGLDSQAGSLDCRLKSKDSLKGFEVMEGWDPMALQNLNTR